VRTTAFPLSVLVLSCGVSAVGCSGSGAAVGLPTTLPSTGGVTSAGGNAGSGGVGNLGGASAGGNDSANGGSSVTIDTRTTGGESSVGGAPTTGGKANTGGSVATGGKATSGGAATGGVATGGAATGGAGTKATGGAATGGAGTKATGGAATGGFTFATGGFTFATGGSKATGGAGTTVVTTATGGGSTVSTSTIADIDCANLPAMPTGGTVHTYGSGQQTGGTNPLSWEIWSNGGSPGSLTTFSTPAFSATWNNSQNYLGRLGYEWGNSGGAYTTHGTIIAQYASKKTGSSNGSWSYVGMYGWTTNPCIEWYIVDDSYSTMPINPGNCPNMSNSPLSIDGGKYTMCKRNTSGTGGDRCGGAGNWNQYYSIRQNNRTCGTISVSEHFKAWEAAGNSMAGKLLEVKILVEVGGGQGTVDFPIAKVIVDK
jgi:endo-1,4-beta-xylanase